MLTTEETVFFFFNDTATTEIYTLSLHDALPISRASGPLRCRRPPARRGRHAERPRLTHEGRGPHRSEEHTSELQSQSNLVCRLLLEKKKLSQWVPMICDGCDIRRRQRCYNKADY